MGKSKDKEPGLFGVGSQNFTQEVGRRKCYTDAYLIYTFVYTIYHILEYYLIVFYKKKKSFI